MNRLSNQPTPTTRRSLIVKALASSVFVLLNTCAGGANAVEIESKFRRALPGYVFKFPADHASHDDFKTEWWYYTGHLAGKQANQKYGFELTFFRSGLEVPKQVQSRWKVDNMYLAHFAVTDLEQQNFFFSAKTNRPGAGTGGADTKSYRVWNGGWTAQLQGNNHVLKASTPEYGIDFKLTPLKSPIVHGKDGVSQKASCKGCASHYYSMSRMAVSGTLTRKGTAIPVNGFVWMDHEFGSNQLTKEQVGWDWFSIQLEDNSELMLYVMRLKSGGLDVNSSGTIIGVDGKVQHLNLADYKIEVLNQWKSASSNASYPNGWRLRVPGRQLELTIEPLLANQELLGENAGGVTYWEGACRVSGNKNNRPIKGNAYVELTGYAGAFTNEI